MDFDRKKAKSSDNVFVSCFNIGCGSLIGVLVGVFLAVHMCNASWQVVCVVGSSVVICGILAGRYGERAITAMLDSIPFI
ncbi:hypothetical protein [Blastopirellula marina]|uniref:hypothetical protein n=1 Tax=Blastopirellula marina TaxID=124 RepID=UPI001304F587|nr:hypothetical protein [Blastopirellula marina]